MNFRANSVLAGIIAVSLFFLAIIVSNQLIFTRITDNSRAQQSSSIPCEEMGNDFTCAVHGKGRCTWIACPEYLCRPRCISNPVNLESFLQKECPITIKTRDLCRQQTNVQSCDQAGCAWYFCSEKCRARDYSHWFEECTDPNQAESRCTSYSNSEECNNDRQGLCNWIWCGNRGVGVCGFKGWTSDSNLCDFGQSYNKCSTPTPTPTKIPCNGDCVWEEGDSCSTGYCYVGEGIGRYGYCRNRQCVDSSTCDCPIATPMPTNIPTPIPTRPSVCENVLQCLYPCNVHSDNMPGGGEGPCQGAGRACWWCATKQKCLSTGVTNKLVNGVCTTVPIESC